MRPGAFVYAFHPEKGGGLASEQHAWELSYRIYHIFVRGKLRIFLIYMI